MRTKLREALEKVRAELEGVLLLSEKQRSCALGKKRTKQTGKTV